MAESLNVFTPTLIAWSRFKPLPGHVVVPLDKALCVDFPGGDFEQAANLNGKKSTKTGKL